MAISKGRKDSFTIRIAQQMSYKGWHNVFFAVGILGLLPVVAPGTAWRTRWPDMQEMAIPHLMKRLNIGMTYDEMTDVMGLPEGRKRKIQKDGVELYSYNVNSWYNRGIDITLKDGRIVNIFEYD